MLHIGAGAHPLGVEVRLRIVNMSGSGGPGAAKARVCLVNVSDRSDAQQNTRTQLWSHRPPVRDPPTVGRNSYDIYAHTHKPQINKWGRPNECSHLLLVRILVKLSNHASDNLVYLLF